MNAETQLSERAMAILRAAQTARIHADTATTTAMTFDDYETAASRTTNLKLTDTERLMDAAAGLSEESGEILSLVRKHAYQSKPLDKHKLEVELGDALWCLAITARTAGLSLEQIASANVAKLRERYPDGYRDR